MGNEGPRAASVQVRTEGPDLVAPEAPSNLSVVADEVDIGRITVRWSPVAQDADGGELTGLAGYIVYRSEGGNSSFVPINSVGADTREYVDTGLQALTTYAYRVLAFDEAGNESSVSNTAQTQTLGVPVPVNLIAVAAIGRIELRWNAVDDEDLLGYNLFRSSRSDEGYVLLSGDEGVEFTTGQTAYIDSNLAAGAQFFYKVQAVAGAGQLSELSGFVGASVAADQIAPAVPANVSAVPDEEDFGRVVVTWSAVVQDVDGSALTSLSGYAVFRSKDTNTAFEQVAVVASDQELFVDSGLSSSSTYFYTVSAFDAAGNESRRSNSVQVRTEGPDQVGPQAPQNISAVPDGEDFGRVVVRWSPAIQDADGGDLTGLVNYVVFRSKGSANSFVPIATLASDAREFADTGLEPLTTYFYTVSASDEVGNEGPRAASVQVRTEGPDQVSPQAPQNLSVVPDEEDFGRAVVTWSPAVQDADGGDLTGLEGYVVFRSKGSTNSFVPVDTLSADTREFADTGLEPLTTYVYTVSAFDAAGNESNWANPVQTTTEGPDRMAPAAPDDLVAIADPSAAQIIVTWAPPLEDADSGDLTGLASYIILRSESGTTSFVAVDTVNSTVVSYVDTGLDPLTTYAYAVRAVDDSGNVSESSSSISATTAGIEIPIGISATGDIGQIIVSWSGSSEEDLLGYNVYRSTRSDEGYVRQIGTEGTSFTTGQTAYIDSGITGGTTFFYRISVVTSDGESDPSSFEGATAVSDIRAPAAPSFIEGVPVEGEPEQLSITWKPPTTDINGSSLTGLSSYQIFRSESSGGIFTQVGTSTDAAFIDTGLVAVTTYYYQIQASDGAGNLSNFSATTALTTGGVDMPSNVRLSSSTPSDITEAPTVTIRWDGSIGAILHYEVQRTTVAASTTDSDFTSIDPNSLDTFRDDNTVVRGTTYYYRVRARDVDERVSDWTALMSVEVKN